MKKNLPLILIIDDDRTTLMMLEAFLTKNDYKVIKAHNAQEAKKLIGENHENISAIVLDRMMPDMDGIEVVKWINNSNFLKPPIVMQTALDKPEDVKDGIDAGIFYYLTKPVQKDVLKSVIASAVKESEQHKVLNEEFAKHRVSFKLMSSASFKIQTLAEAESLSCFIANSFPNPYRILPAIGELLINAIEHGNCEISYDEKTKLIKDGSWMEEVEKRIELKKNKNKFVDVLFSKDGDKYIIKISDQGQGFSWRKFLNVDQARALDNHGRGIARANMLFHSLEYKEPGNQVTAIVDDLEEKNFKW